MAANLDVQTLAQYCEALYNPATHDSRVQAEKLLAYHFPTFSSSGSNAPGVTASGDANSHSPTISSPIQSALLCRHLLQSTTNPYAMMQVFCVLRVLFATTRLKTLVEDHFTTFKTEEQHGLRSFVLEFIYRNPELPLFISSAQAQLFAVLTKLGWVENEDFRNVLESIQVFFQQGVMHRILGLRILDAIVVEMNLPKNASKYRKVAVGFRDAQLLLIFQAALSMLQYVAKTRLVDPNAEKLKDAILVLMRDILGFDFIGTQPDESSDDVGSVQAPTTWRVVFEDREFLEVLWKCWQDFESPSSVLVLECLSQAVSIRRSLFSGEEARQVYIQHIMREIALTLDSPQRQVKLQDVSNYHEFTRMLSRFIKTFQLSELSEYKEFQKWISTIGDFTTSGFHAWKWSPNSIPYLLVLWGKIVPSLGSANKPLTEYIQDVTVQLSRAYLKSRLECVVALVEGEVDDDPLENEEELLPTLEQFASIARTKYPESGRFLVAELQDLTNKYRQLGQRAMAASSPTLGSSDLKEQLMVVEMQMAWVLYIVGACVGARTPYQSTAEQDQMDGELACEVLTFIEQNQLMKAQRPPWLVSPDAHLYVQSSIIYFFSEFRRIYISEDSSKATKVYTQLGDRWGLNTPMQFLEVIMNTSLGNLRSSDNPEWRHQEDQIVVRTLKLFSGMAAGYTSVKHMRKLDTTKSLLANHTSADLRFLHTRVKSSDTAVQRCRIQYYIMLSRVLFAEDNIDADFWRFVRPWETTLDEITLAFEGSGSLSEADLRHMLLGIFKDLRGFVSSITNRKQYMLFFDWFYPAYTPIVQRAMEIWPYDDLGIAILRFWNEFVTNKSQRVTFDSSSPNGILLFRETSKLLYTYGHNLLNRPLSNPSSRWAEKYKGIMLYFDIVASSLSGKYVNFGVFKLYGDKALEQVLEVFYQLMLAIPIEDMIDFPKLSQAYFAVLDVFMNDHMTGLSSMPPPVIEYMFRALGAAITPQSLDSTSSTLACSSIDKVCTFVINWIIKDGVRKESDDGDTDSVGSPVLSGGRSSAELSRPPNSTGSTNGSLKGGGAGGGGGGSSGTNSRPVSRMRQRLQEEQREAHWLVQYILTDKRLLNYLFVNLFYVVVFENRSNHWSLSRPLLGLILLDRDFFVRYTTMFIHAQLPDRQEQVQKAVSSLMENIDFNLTTTNRDRFTQNTTAFKRECVQMTLMPLDPDALGSSMD
ncbi:Exportin 7 [Actinomortierella ambigua]|nr:Exportin 7 [Actinomortierella ambigua]